MTVTRAVIRDLWPVYQSGDASGDTRSLIEAFLRDNPGCAQQLTPGIPLRESDAPLPADAQSGAVVRIRPRFHSYTLLLNLAVLFSCFAFGRIIADTSWDVSPRSFIAVAAVAMGFWVAFCVSLWRARARILIVPGKEPGRQDR